MIAMINLDMLAVGPSMAIGGSEELVTQALAIAEQLRIDKVTRLSGPRLDASDHVSFRDAGIRAVFIHRPDDPNYHTAQDRAQFVKPEALQAAGNLSLRLIEQLLEKQAA
jgi:Zn-dependent M28 family amino/carboxypeptidase